MFKIKKKYGVLKHLVNDDVMFSFGVFIGDLDIAALNNIYQNLKLVKKPFNPDNWLKLATKKTVEHYLKPENFKFTKDLSYDELELIMALKLVKTFNYTTDSIDSLFIDILKYLFYLSNLSWSAIGTYQIHRIEADLQPIWYSSFLPVIEVKQMNNNPWSELPPDKDPTIDWGIRCISFDSRSITNIFNRTVCVHKLLN